MDITTLYDEVKVLKEKIGELKLTNPIRAAKAEEELDMIICSNRFESLKPEFNIDNKKKFAGINSSFSYDKIKSLILELFQQVEIKYIIDPNVELCEEENKELFDFYTEETSRIVSKIGNEDLEVLAKELDEIKKSLRNRMLRLFPREYFEMEKCVFKAQYSLIEECIRTRKVIRFYAETPDDELREVLGILADKCKEILNMKDERLLEIQYKIKKETYISESENYDLLFMLVYMARKIIAGEPIQIVSAEPTKIEEQKKIEKPKIILKDGDTDYKESMRRLHEIRKLLYTESVENLAYITSNYFKYGLINCTDSEIEEIRTIGAEILYRLYKRAKKEGIVVILPDRIKGVLAQALINIDEINKISTFQVSELLSFEDSLTNYAKIFNEYINGQRREITKQFDEYLDTILQIEEIIARKNIVDFTGGSNKYLVLKSE